jgi:hypothetical protein
MTVFSEKARQLVIELLTNWAQKEVEEAKARASAAGLGGSAFINTIKQNVALEAGLNAKGIVEYYYYGNVFDRDFIRFWRGQGRRGISTEEIKDWLENKGGLSKMGGYKGQEKNPQRQIREMAWAIRRKWEKDGGRKGRPWGGMALISESTEEMQNKLFEAFQSEIYETVLANLK